MSLSNSQDCNKKLSFSFYPSGILLALKCIFTSVKAKPTDSQIDCETENVKYITSLLKPQRRLMGEQHQWWHVPISHIWFV